MSETLVTCPVCQIPNFTEGGLRAHRCKGPLAAALARTGTVIDGKAEVLPPATSLEAIKLALEETRGRLVAAEEVFLATTLADRLKIGLRCYQAHLVFAHNPGKGGKPSRRDGSAPESFEGWLADETPWLKKPTAYKYMTAFRGLSLDERATAITSVTVDGVTTTNYVADLDSGIVYAGSSASPTTFTAGRQNVVVTYTTGASTIAPSVIAGARTIAAHIYASTQQARRGRGRSGDGDGTTMVMGYSVPNAAIERLRSQQSRRMPGFA